MRVSSRTTIRGAAVIAACATTYGLGATGCAAILGIEDAVLGYEPDAGQDGSGGSDAAPPMACTTLADCPAGETCSVPVCLANQCGVVAASAGIPCPGPLGATYVCDGAGECVECLSNDDCAANAPVTPVCDLVLRKCVSCSNGIKDGQEEDVDCGGPDCGACLGRPCHPQLGFAQGAACATPENVCCASACGQKCEACSMAKTGQPDGTCAPVLVGEDPDGECAALGGCGAAPGKCRCEDGVKNGDESDVDCGGMVCAKCGGGKACVVDQDCAADVPACVDGACCQSICTVPCLYCNSTGSCVAAVGQSDTTCGPDQACGVAGSGCVGKAGAPCSFGFECVSAVCTAGACAKSAIGKPCNTSSDCVEGATCQNFVCSP